MRRRRNTAKLPPMDCRPSHHHHAAPAPAPPPPSPRRTFANPAAACASPAAAATCGLSSYPPPYAGGASYLSQVVWGIGFDQAVGFCVDPLPTLAAPGPPAASILVLGGAIPSASLEDEGGGYTPLLPGPAAAGSVGASGSWVGLLQMEVGEAGGSWGPTVDLGNASALVDSSVAALRLPEAALQAYETEVLLALANDARLVLLSVSGSRGERGLLRSRGGQAALSRALGSWALRLRGLMGSHGVRCRRHPGFTPTGQVCVPVRACVGCSTLPWRSAAPPSRRSWLPSLM